MRGLEGSYRKHVFKLYSTAKGQAPTAVREPGLVRVINGNVLVFRGIRAGEISTEIKVKTQHSPQRGAMEVNKVKNETHNG